MGRSRNHQKTGSGLFRDELPKMPEGYYSGDKPNPNLRAFVEQHLKEKPYDPARDKYDVPAFDKTIETTKATAIYNMHSYHQGKKPHDAIRQYIRHYTQPGDLVLDPFCGSGGTALAALMEGRKAIAIDRSPAATFITKNYCTPVDVNELRKAFEELKRKVKPEIDWLYETKCDRCGGKATTAYTVYSQVFQCPRCMEKVPLFDCVQSEGRTAAGKAKKVNVCPHCHERGHDEVIRSQSEKFGSVPVLVCYICQNGCTPVRAERLRNDPHKKKRLYFEEHDLKKLANIGDGDIPHWYPRGYSMTRFSRYQRDALYYYGVKELSDLYTRRNLWALSAIREAALASQHADTLLFGMSAILINLSRMQGNTRDPRFPNNILRGTYYLPQVMREYEVLTWYEGKIRNLCDGYRKLSTHYGDYGSMLISTQSACSLTELPSNAVDFIFTDPPYGDKVQYGELNFTWEAWRGVDAHWHDEEIIVNEVRGKSEADWAGLMRQAIAECYRVLKPGRWLSLCYHDTSEGTWALVQDIMAEAGFLVDRSKGPLFIDTQEKSFNQLTADKVTKRDLVINFRKPKAGEVAAAISFSGAEDASTFGEKVRAIIREYLSFHPGCSKDRIYDEVVSRMVRAGQMQAHNFDEILAQVAEPAAEAKAPTRGERWYLRDRELDVVDAAESAKEDTAAESVANFITKMLKAHPEQEGVHYSDIFEHYVYAVKDKPRRPLVEWLLDYFYKTEAGTYRLPDTEEEQRAKAEGRSKGINRHVKRYLTWLEQGVTIPSAERPNDATLVEWIRHCKRAGLYDQGKMLYEKGGLNAEKLPEEQQAALEEDYQVCVRMLTRGGGAAPKKNRTKRSKGDDHV